MTTFAPLMPDTITPEPNGLTREYRALSQLLAWRWEDNPKAHNEELIETSIRKYGFNDPPEVDEQHETIVVGHGRLEFLARIKALFDSDHPDGFLPQNILLLPDGDWGVPVIILQFPTREDALRYAMVHNRSNTATLRAEDYDQKKLTGALARAAEAGQLGMFGGIGFGQTELKAGGFGEGVTSLFDVPPPVDGAWDSPGNALALAPGGIGEGTAGAPGAAAPSLPPDSHVGMLQLFFTQQTRAVFVKRCERLAKVLGLNSTTEVVGHLVQEAYRVNFGADEVPASVLPGQIGFGGEVVGGAPEPPVGISLVQQVAGIVMGAMSLPDWNAADSAIDLNAPVVLPEAGEPVWKGTLCPTCGGSGFTGMRINMETRKQEKIICDACEGAGDKESWDKAHTLQTVSLL
jgi:hypothetical protein